MGTLPGKKFVWLKAEGVKDLDAETVRINPKYARLLELSTADKVEATYKTFTLIAKVKLSETVPIGKAQISKEHLSKVPEGTALLLMKSEKKKK